MRSSLDLADFVYPKQWLISSKFLGHASNMTIESYLPHQINLCNARVVYTLFHCQVMYIVYFMVLLDSVPCQCGSCELHRFSTNEHRVVDVGWLIQFYFEVVNYFFQVYLCYSELIYWRLVVEPFHVGIDCRIQLREVLHLVYREICRLPVVRHWVYKL